MTRWSVSVEATGPGPYGLSWAEDILEAPSMAGRGLAMSAGEREVGLTFDVEAEDAVLATARGVQMVLELAPELQPYRVQAETVDAQERRLAESDAPPVLGPLL